MRRVSFDRASRAVGLGLLFLTGLSGSGEAAGFREQTSWQFRSPSETQTKLNEEALRLQLEQQGAVVGGGAGGAISVPLSSGGGGLGLGSGGTTLGNQTNTTTNVTVTVTGDNNDVNVDGYLNLEAEQTTDGQTSTFGAGDGR